MDKNLIQRLITGTVFVVVLVGGIMWNEWSFFGLFLLITVLGLWEFYRLSAHVPAAPWRIYGTAVGAMIFAAFFFKQYLGLNSVLLGLIPFLFLPFFFELYTKSDKPFTNLAYTFMGWIYVSLPFALWGLIMAPHWQEGFCDIDEKTGMTSLVATGMTKYSGKILLGFFIILWTSDSLAYVCGRLFGKHKLFERISPKKTWEGFIGGMIFTIAAAWIVWYFLRTLPVSDWMVMAGIVAATGTLGDLAESMFKRSIGIKDSGNILPGHGGILDRFDAVLLASPFVTSYLLLRY
ncbi:MAG: phosphatidate cytidylyltransferase [Bacteroidetes bacterium]|nr:phosphatidate cytidylyltransferase [Bacteroidota bacterium]